MSQLLTSSEVRKHNHRKSLWIVIHNDVYDVTRYLNEHPGGEDPLLDAAGMDATTAFEDVGHSDAARSQLKKFKIGSLRPGESCSKTSRSRVCLGDDKKWHKNKKGRLSPKSSTFSKLSRKLSSTKSSARSPRTIPRVPSIVVPRESGSKWKWALLALAAAIIFGVAYKKYAS